MKRRLLGDVGPESLGQVVRRSGTAGAVRLAGVALRLALAVVVAHILGARGLGLYVLALTLSGGAGVLASIGLDATAVRFTAHHLGRDELSELHGLVVFCSVVSAAAGLAIGAALLVGAPQLAAWLTRPEIGATARLVALGVPLAVLGTVSRSGLCGFGNVGLAATLEQLGPPLVTVAVLVPAHLLRPDSAQAGVVAVTIAQAVVGLISFLCLWSRARRARAAPVFRPGLWLRFSLPMWADHGLLYVVGSVGYFLVARWRGTEELAVYGASIRLALLVGLPLVAVSLAFGPVISSLAARGEWARLREMYAPLTRALLVAGVVVGGAVVAGGRWALAGFGPRFAGGYTCLAVLVVGQIVNSGTGPSGLVLVMTGQVRRRLGNALLGAAVTVGLSLVAVPRWGAAGAAGAVALSTSLVNLLQVRQVHTLLRARAGGDPAPQPRPVANVALPRPDVTI